MYNNNISATDTIYARRRAGIEQPTWLFNCASTFYTYRVLSIMSSPAVQFNAYPSITFPVQNAENVSPRAIPQLPYLLTITPEHDIGENKQPQTSVPLLVPMTSIENTQAHLFMSVRQKVSEAAERVEGASQRHRQRKQKKSHCSCVWCNSLWLFGDVGSPTTTQAPWSWWIVFMQHIYFNYRDSSYYWHQHSLFGNLAIVMV